MASPPSPWFSFSDGNFMLSNIAGVDPFDETLGSGNTIAPPATVSSSWMPGGIPMSQNGTDWPSYQPDLSYRRDLSYQTDLMHQPDLMHQTDLTYQTDLMHQPDPSFQLGPSYQPVQPVPAMPVENIGSFQQQPNVPYANLGPFQYPLDVLRTQQAQSSSSVSAPVVETTRPAPDFGSPLTVHHDTNMTEEPRYATRDQ
ncbi:hypothetical protein ASPNIDRAFT_43855 [Aspergillus niger ATCC 1015]|uniref:Uncharacterized protein n=1 Tax=Aspergillus niger (strain ATCC 1015 / CBS 113.46 / FGSC A1144 / LSHB Ac4 / NCTC 3858a / NRRL 328 / USDA 3528.7) TaxID=380704 RepID=G3XUA3_ASPNA|nr:hypothetical protein ASPNIDRAFT_43855 [Aspergillus niger ATCC 1015]